MWPGGFLYSEHNGASIYEIDIFIFRRFDSFGLLWVQQNIICDLKREPWAINLANNSEKALLPEHRKYGSYMFLVLSVSGLSFQVA